MGATEKVLISEGLEKMPNMEEGLVKKLGELAERSKSEVIIISTDSEEVSLAEGLLVVLLQC